MYAAGLLRPNVEGNMELVEDAAELESLSYQRINERQEQQRQANESRRRAQNWEDEQDQSELE